MSDKTKRYSWVRWIFVAALLILVGMGSSHFLSWPDLSPWEPASQILMDISLSEFSGDATFANWDLRLKALGGIILLFVMGPSLWIYAEIRNQSTEQDELSEGFMWHFDDIARKGILWYIGVVLVLAGLTSVPATVIKGIVFQNSQENMVEVQNTDELKSQLAALGFEATEQFYLPRKFGGGSGSFQHISSEDGKVRAIKLADLESYNTDTENSYVLAPKKSDSTLKIIGVSHQEGINPDFKNADGRKGKIQVAIKISPPSDFEFISSNTR